LLNLATRVGATAGLVVREDPPVCADVRTRLDALADSVMQVQSVATWPGTELLVGRASLYRLRLDARVLHYLSASVSGLYEWQAPTLPEDLACWRPDGSLLLASIAHERDAWLELR